MAGILRVGHIVPDTEAEGPGRRFAIWVQGCPLRCPGCCNPELFGFSGGTQRRTDELAAEIVSAATRASGIEGVSFLGGEPFSQPQAVLDVARRVREAGLSVMIFTGFTLAELRARKRADIDALIAETDLLLDGRYERDLPDTDRRWVGSTNQVMHFLTERYSANDEQFTQPNTVEIRLSRDGMVVNGWPSGAEALIAALGATDRDDHESSR